MAQWARNRWRDLPLWLGGFSFGGFIAMQGALQLAPSRLITVAPAINYFPAGSLHLSALDWLLVQGDADDIVPALQVSEWVQGLDYQPRLVLMEGAGHFFHGRLNELRQTILAAFDAA